MPLSVEVRESSHALLDCVGVVFVQSSIHLCKCLCELCNTRSSVGSYNSCEYCSGEYKKSIWVIITSRDGDKFFNNILNKTDKIFPNAMNFCCKQQVGNSSYLTY